MTRATTLPSTLLLVVLGGCAIDWKVPESQVADAGADASGGGGGGAAGAATVSSSSAGGDGGGTPCDDGTNCGACLSCELTADCQDAYAACMSDPDCAPIQSCAIACPPEDSSTTCIERCVAGHRAGEERFADTLACFVCHECPLACAEIGSWACPGT